MKRPIYESIVYDTGSELEDLRLFRKDIEDYADFLEKERNKQLALCEVSNQRETFNAWFVYLDELSENEYDNRSITEHVEDYLKNI